MSVSLISGPLRLGVRKLSPPGEGVRPRNKGARQDSADRPPKRVLRPPRNGRREQRRRGAGGGELAIGPRCCGATAEPGKGGHTEIQVRAALSPRPSSFARSHTAPPLTAGRGETKRRLRRRSARSSALRSSRSASHRSCCRSSLLRAGESRLSRSRQLRTMPRMRRRSVRGSGAGSDSPRPSPGCPRCSGGVITWRWLWHRGASVSPMEPSCRPSSTSNCTGRG